MIYEIKQGKHYAKPTINRLWLGWNVQKIKFNTNFIDDPYYDLGNEDNDDINKLYGLSFGLHHEYSYRIGWRPAGPHSISYHHYYYVNGERKMSTIMMTRSYARTMFQINIWRRSNKISVFYSMGSSLKCSEIDFDFTNAPKWSYKLFPYFGGNNPATKDLRIDVSEYK